MASSSRLSESSSIERAFKLSKEQFDSDTFIPEAQRAFSERTAEATINEAANAHKDPNQEALIRDSRTNPRVLEYRVEQALESMHLHKLRYKEQLSKKLFLEMLRDNVKVTHEDNQRLREKNLASKATLKQTKSELRAEYAQIKEESTNVGRKAQSVRERLDQGAELVKKIEEMRWELAMIRSSKSADQRLTIDQMVDRLATQDDKLMLLTEREDSLSERSDAISKEIAESNARLEKLAVEKPRAAIQARKLHDMDMNERAEVTSMVTTRRNFIDMYQKLMGIQPLFAASENELRIPFELPGTNGRPQEVVTLSLVFNPANRRLAGAQLIGSEVDIEELLLLAKETNDVPGFVRNVRRRLESLSGTVPPSGAN